MLQTGIFDYAQLSVLVHGLNKGQLGVCLIGSALQDNNLAAAFKDYKGRIEKVTLVVNARLGTSYQNKVENRATGQFETEALRGAEWIDFPFFKRTKNGITLSFNWSPSDKQTKVLSFMLVDGQLNPTDEVEQMFQPSKRSGARKPSAKQAAAGISASDEVRVMQFFVERVHLVTTKAENAYEMFEMLKGGAK